MKPFVSPITGLAIAVFAFCAHAQDSGIASPENDLRNTVIDANEVLISSLPVFPGANTELNASPPTVNDDSKVIQSSRDTVAEDTSFESAFAKAYGSMIPSNVPAPRVAMAPVEPDPEPTDHFDIEIGQATPLPAFGSEDEIADIQLNYSNNSGEFAFDPNDQKNVGKIVTDQGQVPNIEFNPSSESEDIFWWQELVTKPFNPNNVVQETDTNTLIYAALSNSPRIQAISKDPLVRELQVTEAESDFDPVSFVRGQFDDRNDPVGNTLTTGGAPFLQDHIISAVAGVRKKTLHGSQVELGQTIGFQNSNSRFFVPQDQGTATLALNYTQPLLRGRGRYYNESQILIAQSTGGLAWEAFKTELQEELESVVEAYWQLYYDRSVFLQKKRNVVRGEMILELLEGRRNLDSLPSQIARAKSAVLSRKTELVTTYNDVRNAETELRRLIADPNWLKNQSIELLPREPAVRSNFDVPLSQVVQTALEHRPEIKETMQRAKIAAIQYDVSTNELMPELSFLFGTYLAALEGDSGIERAFQRQFAGTTPGYSLGLEFEFPINNRAARSRLAQRSVQRSKIRHEVNEVMQNIIAESQVAHRRLQTAYQTMDAATYAIEAARADLMQNRQRWKSFALVEGDIADGQTPTTVLDQLLDSQDRLTNAELVYSQAEQELKISEVGLRRTMGTLLMHEQVVFNRTCEDNAPAVNIQRMGEHYPATEMGQESYDLYLPDSSDIVPVTEPKSNSTRHTTSPLPNTNNAEAGNAGDGVKSDAALPAVRPTEVGPNKPNG